MREYDSIIHDQVDKKVVQVIADTDLKTEGNQRVHYLPQMVIRRDKETRKLRVVYDA